jgi:hypothetical protein
MNLEQDWEAIPPADKDLAALLAKGIPKQPSKDPLQKVKRNLLYNSIIGFCICIMYIVVITKFPVWEVLLCIGIVLAFTLLASIKALLLFKSINNVASDNTLLQEMKKHYATLTVWMKMQQQVALFIYPVSAAGGFMIGGSIGAGRTIDEIMQKPVIVIAMVITIILLIPPCYYLAKWMNKKAFGNYVQQLKQNIDALENEQ